MRKFILSFVLSIASFASFAQSETPAATQATAAEAPTSAASAAEPSVAGTLGKWLGRAVSAPVQAAKAFAGGVAEGYKSATQPAPSQSVEKAVSTSTTDNSEPSVLKGRVLSALSSLPGLSNAFKREPGEAPAPIEDRSVKVSSNGSH